MSLMSSLFSLMIELFSSSNSNSRRSNASFRVPSLDDTPKSVLDEGYTHYWAITSV